MRLIFGIFLTNEITGFFSAIGIFLCSIYSIWLYNRIIFGNISNNTTVFKDIDKLDFVIIFSLIFLFLFLGFFPSYITSLTYLDTLFLLECTKISILI